MKKRIRLLLAMSLLNSLLLFPMAMKTGLSQEYRRMEKIVNQYEIMIERLFISKEIDSLISLLPFSGREASLYEKWFADFVIREAREELLFRNRKKDRIPLR